MTYMQTSPEEHVVSIMAGNPIVKMHEDGSISIDPQLVAFEAALRIASQTREQIAKVYVVFDHIGYFRTHFVRKDVPSKRKFKPSLADCISQISDTYLALSDKYDVPLENISIIPEEYLASSMREILPTLKPAFYYHATRPDTCKKEGCIRDDDEEDRGVKITCKGIVAAIVERLARHSDDMHLIWEEDKDRCKPDTILGGIELARHIFPLEGKKLTNTIFFPGKGPITKSCIL